VCVSKMSSDNEALPKAGPLLEEGRLTWDWAALSEVGSLLEKDRVNCDRIFLSIAISLKK
jgi:hypothetical protein